MPKVNKTQYAILGVLSLKPGSGYDIKKFCDHGIAHFWNENFGHIYPVLQRMEQEGLVTKETASGEKKPLRHIYHITSKGREALRMWLIQPIENTPTRSELLLKLAFADNAAPETMINHLEQARERCREKLALLRQIEQHLLNREKTPQSEEQNLYWLATLRYGLYATETSVKWCEETIQSILKYQKERGAGK